MTRHDPESRSGRAETPATSGTPGTIRVLIVDDSALMRRLLTDLLAGAPDIEVIGSARDGRDAVLQASRLQPDVITLDVEMPEVSGLDALPSLLAICPARVIMVSSLTQEGADVTLQALEIGAFDYMPKPERNQLAQMRASGELLVSKVRAAAEGKVRRERRTRVEPGAPAPAERRATPRPTASASAAPAPPTPAPAPAPAPTRPSTTQPASPESSSSARPRTAKPERTGSSSSSSSSTVSPLAACVVIGISTGGPQALSKVFPLISPPMPPILVVQHMPGQFTGVFAQRLDRFSTLTIKEAAEGDLILPDHVLVAPGGRHMSVSGHGPRFRISLSDEPAVSGHRPSVDVLFLSAAKAFQAGAIGILMTGMGHDGVEGCKAILNNGGFTLGQDGESSVVYGMNKAAFQAGAIRHQFSLEELPEILRNIAAFREQAERRR